MAKTTHGGRTRKPPAPASPQVAALELEVRELTAEVASLRQACRLKDEHLSIATHELSAPLAAMKAYVEALLEHYDDPTFDQTGEFLEVLDRETDRLIRLVERTLEISRLTWRGTGLQRQPTPLADLVAEVVPSLQPLLEERRIRLAVVLPSGLPAVSVDRDLVKQVLLNLIHNAIKFSPECCPVTVTAAAAGEDEVAVEVCDEGYGVAGDEIQRLFEPYFRSSDERVERQRGTGLGLSIVKTIVESHGGRIEVRSQLERGTTFRFTLPRA
jgi:signal transduction histidine kinase